jgi:predicted regulator of Ras-like GTPase activity (Roadblock/LC7/MglB family)
VTLDRDRIAASFRGLVNMSAAELAEWLATDESRAAGQMQADGETIGHAAGRRILAILATPQAELGDEDYRHMRRAVGFIRRHLAQEPANPVTSRWRRSLMNWGHDPLIAS